MNEIECMKWFALFVFVIGPGLCCIFCLLGIWETKRADRSIERFEKQRKERIARGLKASGVEE